MRVAAARAAVSLILVGWGALSLCAGAGATARLPSDLERVLERMTDAIGAPGGVMMLDDGQRVRRVAVGVAKRRSPTPMPKGGRFRVHSMTKTFTAVVVLQLAAEGRLSLDDTVDRWLAERLTGANGITVRQLLNHTSGVYDAGGRGPVGSYWYANRNYELLSALVQLVTGASLAAEIERRIVASLRLRHTSWPTRRSVRGLVRGYELASGDDATLLDPSTLTGAVAIVSTAIDLRRFLRGLFGGALLLRESAPPCSHPWRWTRTPEPSTTGTASASCATAPPAAPCGVVAAAPPATRQSPTPAPTDAARSSRCSTPEPPATRAPSEFSN